MKSIEAVKNWVWLVYKPAKDPNIIRHFFPIPRISRVYVRVKRGVDVNGIIVQYINLDSVVS